MPEPRAIVLQADGLPRWRRLPYASQTPGFHGLLQTIPNPDPERLRWEVNEDDAAPGHSGTGGVWVRRLWYAEREVLEKRGEIVRRSLLFTVIQNLQLEHVGFDSRYRIWPQWFGLEMGKLHPGDKILIRL